MTYAQVQGAAFAAAEAAVNSLPPDTSGLTASNIHSAVVEAVRSWLVPEGGCSPIGDEICEHCGAACDGQYCDLCLDTLEPA